jgi:NAD(P)-dependent dehydrogenase (short-subunit alcohol dehydrogenase family)
MGRLDQKIVVLTGAGSGIGRATAIHFATLGARLILGDLDESAVRETERAIVAQGAKAIAVPVDVTDDSSIRELVEVGERRLGGIEGLFHSAGIAGGGTALDCDLDLWQQVLDTNLKGSWLAAKAVLPSMIESGGGSIVLVASVAGLVGIPSTAAYSASKGGVIALARQMAVDFAPQRVRVNAICPGTVATRLVLDSYAQQGAGDEADIEARLAVAGSRYPLNQIGSAEEIAGLAAYLASDDARWVTGTAVPIDGGLTAVGWQTEGPPKDAASGEA